MERPYISIITEYVPRGSLRTILNDENTIIPDVYVLKVSLQYNFLMRHQLFNANLDVHCFQLAVDTAKAMKYLHDCHIIHRDLKSDNILVSDVLLIVVVVVVVVFIACLLLLIHK